MARYDNVLQTIGRTPLIRLNRLAPEGINVFVKTESANPMGSIKDRMALALIEDAERSGQLKPGQTVVEATSGNTGIGLAMVCAQKGYPLIVAMAENFSIERRKLLRFLGARVILTPASEKGTGMLNKARELAETHGYFLCRQFENPANAEIHYRTTAREIVADMGADTLDYWVSGFGTGGTLLGCARALKEADPRTRIVVAEPDNSQLLGSGISQPRDENGTPSSSHPNFRPHLMQGWSPDFVSTLTEEAKARSLIDLYEPVSGADAMELSRQLARQEGIFAGTSGGATLGAALAVARRSSPGTNIVCMLPDTGERYLSTPLFEDIQQDMNDEEIAISQSTPNYRFDVVNIAVSQGDAGKPDITDDGVEDYVTRVIKDEPVVMFALEWCEFGWSVRKLFARLGISYRSIDLDSVACQENDLGGKIRKELLRRTGQSTIPQVFIGGDHIGGCSEIFDALNDGSLKRRFEGLGIKHDDKVSFNPYQLLPSWLHPRKSA